MAGQAVQNGAAQQASVLSAWNENKPLPPEVFEAVLRKTEEQLTRDTTYVPLGEADEITLNGTQVLTVLAHKTKNGHLPPKGEVLKFIMLCKTRGLNPWAGDAYLLGYESEDGDVWSLITAHQALLKRAEINAAFDGMESGVIVLLETGEIKERAGDITYDKEKLLGGWAKLYRSDRKVPFFDRLKLSTYDTRRSRWAKDPAGMIVKCAEASVLRSAFPTQIGGLMIREEMDAVTEPHAEAKQPEPGQQLASTKKQLDALLEGQTGTRAPRKPGKAAAAPPPPKPAAVPPAPNTDAHTPQLVGGTPTPAPAAQPARPGPGMPPVVQQPVTQPAAPTPAPEQAAPEPELPQSETQPEPAETQPASEPGPMVTPDEAPADQAGAMEPGDEERFKWDSLLEQFWNEVHEAKCAADVLAVIDRANESGLPEAWMGLLQGSADKKKLALRAATRGR